MSNPLEGHRGTRQFISRKNGSGEITRRPHHATKRAGELAGSLGLPSTPAKRAGEGQKPFIAEEKDIEEGLEAQVFTLEEIPGVESLYIDPAVGE